MNPPQAGVGGGEVRIPERRAQVWGALAYHDYRILWLGGMLTNVGYWMQFTSLTYLIGIVLSRSEAESALNLGLLGAARALPVLALGFVGGYVADRYPRRRTLSYTNLLMAALGVGLAFVSQAQGGWVLPAVLAIAAVFSAATCFDFPTRQSWITMIVPRRLLANAIGLASFANNVPLIFGPAISGILISTVGVYPSLFIAAFAQSLVVVALIFIKPAPSTTPSEEPMLRQIVVGIRFMVSHATLAWVVLILATSCMFVRPYMFLLAGFAGHVLHVSAAAYGGMLAVGGVGTLAGALTTALYRSDRRGPVWFISGSVLAIGAMVLAFCTNLVSALIVLTVLGLGRHDLRQQQQRRNRQTYAPDDLRGRLMSIYTDDHERMRSRWDDAAGRLRCGNEPSGRLL